MKIKNITIAVIASVGFISAAQAADGTINFTGTITDEACTVTVGNSGTVDLGTVAASAFKSTGDTAAATDFTITLSACPAATKTASISFDGTASSNNSVLALTSAGSTGIATNVGVGIYESDSATPIALRTASKPQTLTADTANVLNFVAKYVSLGSTVGAGTADATTTFTVTYN